MTVRREDNTRQVTLLLRDRSARALNVFAEAARSEIFGVLEESKIGRGIKHPGNRVPSSLPGDPPARQTGRLQESVKVIKRATRNELVAEVGPDPRNFPERYYADDLEFGNNRIAPRPFMRPAISRLKTKIRAVKI